MPLAMSRDDDPLLADLRADGAARERAIVELRELLVRNLRSALSGRATDDAFVEDAVQDSLLRILDRIDQFAGRSRFMTWATAIAIRTAMGELRRSRWKDISLDQLVDDAEFPPPSTIDRQTPSATENERQAIFDAMRQAIEGQLSARQRTALLAELKGMPQDEIARHLHSNRNAVYKLTHDARKKIKRALEAGGYTAADALEATTQ